jgi:proteasome alpha subunit
MGDIKQLYTQHGGVRPFGVRLLVGGVDVSSPHLFETDPSGVVAAYKAQAIGGGADTVMEKIERLYREDMSLDDAILAALQALQLVVEGKVEPKKVEVAVIPENTKRFKKLSDEEKKDYIARIPSKPAKPAKE